MPPHTKLCGRRQPAKIGGGGNGIDGSGGNSERKPPGPSKRTDSIDLVAEKSKRKNRSSSKCTALLPADNGVTEANTNTHRSGDDDGGGGRNGGKRRRETENENERAQ